MNEDGTGLKQLTSNTADEDAPAWSPDRTKIVFDGNRNGNGDILTMNADGSEQTNRTNDSAFDYSSDWQPTT